jgi:hypothetical protein
LVAADWLTAKGLPAIEALPDRALPVFAAIDSVTVPLALPFRPPTTEIQESFAVAFHAQPLSVDTPTATVPPAASTCPADWLNVNVHGAPA